MSEDPFQFDPDATPLSNDELLGLIPSLSTRAELNELERDNINEARLWAMRRRQLGRADLLSDAFARELHRRMFNRVWRWAGRYRSTAKNLGWAVPLITEGVHNACEDSKAWIAYSTYPLVEIAVRFHHKFVLIHPWANGNGRHARLMADILIAAKGGEELTWGQKANLVSAGDVRRRYITAVRSADQGSFAELVAFAQS